MSKFIIYEKLEDYIEMLKKTDKNTPMYISIVRNISEAGLITPSLVVHALIDKEFCKTLRFSEELPMFQMVADNYFSMIPDDKLREESLKAYEARYKTFNEKILAEYNKLVELVKTMDFKHVENAIIQEGF